MYPTNDMVSLLLGFSLALLVGRAAWLDIRQRRIPNNIVATVALLGLLCAAAGGLLAAVLAVAIAVIVLGVGVAVWKLGWLGGGDVKLIAALSVWAGPSQVAELLLAIALSGGLLALAMGVTRHFAIAPTVTLLQVEARRLFPPVASLGAFAPLEVMPTTRSGSGTVPYGVAVAFGGAWLLYRWFQI